METNVNTYQGLNTDAAYDTIPNSFYVDALDIRITTTKGESTGAVTNIKGNKLAFSIPTTSNLSTGNDFGFWTAQLPEIIGVTNIRNKIILFVADDLGLKGWIYQFKYLESDKSTIELSLLYYNPNLNFSKDWPIEAISRYESTTIQRIYWTDYNQYLRSLNIVDVNITSLGLDTLDAFPNITYTSPLLEQIISGGNIPIGIHQFAYKLRSADGKETLISPPGDMIHVTDLPETTPNTTIYTGGVKDTFAQKSLVIKIDTSNYANFKEIILYNAFYSGYNTQPVITEVETKDIAGSSISFTYTGQEEESVVISNFAYQIKSYPFKTCKTLTQKDNSLVIANLRYAKFSIKEYLGVGESFDSRMVRYKTGSPATPPLPPTNEANKLANAFNTEYNKDAHWLQDWRINKQYKFQSNGTRLGGTGPNISFNFTLDKFLLDYQLGDPLLGTIDTPIVAPIPDYDNHRYLADTPNNADQNKTYPNNASPYLSGVYRGYKRGETYRFGIIFYNKKGEASFVNFIGDIKFPDISEPDSINNESDTPYWPISTTGTVNGRTVTFGHTLGIEFSIDFSTCPTLFNNIESYQIVRLQRTTKDKRRLTSGYLFTAKQNGIGPKEDAFDFNFRVPGDSSNNNIYHINGDGNLFGHKSTDPKQITNYGCFCSPELSYAWEGLDDLSDSISNSCFLMTGAVKNEITKHWFTVNDRTGTNLAANSYDIRETFSYTNFIDIFNPSNTDYSKNYIRKIADKNFKRMGSGSNLDNSVVGPYNNFYLRNYFADATESDDLNQPNNGGLDGKGKVAKHASGLLYRMTYLTQDPINNNALTTPDLAIKNNLIPNLINASEESTSLAITDYLHPKEEIYGGYTQSVLEANIFQPCSVVVPKNVNTQQSKTVKVFGGDMFINMFVLQKNTYEVNSALYKRSGGAILKEGYGYGRGYSYFIPCESAINIDLAYGSTAKYNSRYTAGSEALEEYIQEDNNNPLGGAKSVKMYAYNEVYSRENNTLAFFVQPQTQATLGISGTNDIRAYISNVKVNEEKIDSWTKFSPNNYYDIDDYGPINKILNWKDNVFFFQDRAIGTYAINRAAITTTNDGVPTQLGTGEGFGKHQYYSKETGSIHQYGIIPTDKGIYYFDAMHRKIMMFSGETQALSEITGIHSLLQSLPDPIFFRKENGGDNSVRSAGLTFAKDMINDEVLFTFVARRTVRQLEADTAYTIGTVVFYNIEGFVYRLVTSTFTTPGDFPGSVVALNDNSIPTTVEETYNKSITLVFDEIVGQFSSKYSATPKRWIENSDILLSANPEQNTSVYVHNIGNWGEFYGNKKECFIKLVVNPNADINKILRTLEFNSIVRDDNKIIDREATITAFRVETENGDTGKISYSPDRIRRRFDKWRVKLPRDINSLNGRGRLRSTRFVVTLYFDNLNNKELILNRLISFYDIQIF